MPPYACIWNFPTLHYVVWKPYQVLGTHGEYRAKAKVLQKMSWAKQLSPINSNTGEAEAGVFITRSSRLAWMEYKAISDESGWGGIPKDS